MEREVSRILEACGWVIRVLFSSRDDRIAGMINETALTKRSNGKWNSIQEARHCSLASLGR